MPRLVAVLDAWRDAPAEAAARGEVLVVLDGRAGGPPHGSRHGTAQVVRPVGSYRHDGLLVVALGDAYDAADVDLVLAGQLPPFGVVAARVVTEAVSRWWELRGGGPGWTLCSPGAGCAALFEVTPTQSGPRLREVGTWPTDGSSRPAERPAAVTARPKGLR